MNNIRMLTLSLMALISTAVLAMGSDKIIIAKKAAPGSITQEFRQVMHPKISLLDKDGNPVIDDKGIISTGRTCGQCHDYQYIHKHNNHITPTVQADCIVCHFKEGRLGAVPSDYNSAHLRIQLPADENCAQCHGLIYTRSNPLSIPPDYEENFLYRDGKKFYDLTQHTGVIMSAQDLSDSALNLKKKAQLHFAWDVHMHRQLNCISCHFIGNDPRFCGNIPYSLDHLTMDPRKVKSPAEILKRPDHNLKFTSCTCCHNPLKVHNNLPNKKRHLDVLSCESCHIPEVYGPTLQTVDRTVTRANGTPRVEYRGVDESQSHGTTLNTKFIQGYRPFLFRHVFKPRTANTGNTNPGNSLLRYKISPFNLVTNWYWKSSTTGEFVPDSFLQK
ncbi:MAG: hypothetical protein MUF15_19110, partial [Acidobacteria bacterium]|nr:hypothetical protein [Acidobacteriota bacterium]